MMNRRTLIGNLAAMAATPGASAQEGFPHGLMVFGGTGKLGAEIIKLVKPNYPFVGVFMRGSSKTDLLDGTNLNYTIGDLFNSADVAMAFRSFLYRAAVIALRVEDNDLRFYEKAMTVIVAGAKTSGVKHIVHHSAVGAGENAQNFQDLGWEKVPGLLDRLKDQGVGEEILKASGIPYTIIRNARVYPENTPATGKAKLTTDHKVLTPMTRADLARLTVSCLEKKSHFGKTYHVRDRSLKWPPPDRQQS
ncbi:MAG: hypothetical protein FJX59_10405 [Alphaproteobacteria bacterium]|nr:hypothetical protein [Alphaproteobacteria bacterium]